ncbi:MAG: hypothetical protein NVV82_26010 [Sporocytophaga sp.]|nr:hypothetical protein [Sporocytophaga sp.]
MFELIAKGITKIFGTKSERDLKELGPYVQLVNDEYAKLKSISDDQLRSKTAELKAIIASDLKSVDDQIASLHKKDCG